MDLNEQRQKQRNEIAQGIFEEVSATWVNGQMPSPLNMKKAAVDAFRAANVFMMVLDTEGKS